MGQVTYGTITITDTNDIEKIYMEYAQSQNNQTAPTSASEWSENIPTWRQGYYIWQRTVTKMSGVPLSSDSYGDPVCLTGSTGSTGAPGQSVDSIITTYCNYGTGTPAENYSGWQSTVPAYDSTKPNYWVKTVITYSNPTDIDVIIYKDNGITSATSTAAAAWDKADQAQSDASDALSQATTAVEATSLLGGHFIYNSTWQTTNTPHGANVVQNVGIDGIYEQTPSQWQYNTHIGSNGIKLRYNEIDLSTWITDRLTFYTPLYEYHEYNNTTGNPKELGLFEYNNITEEYFYTADEQFDQEKVYYYREYFQGGKGLEITAERIDLYNPSSNQKGLAITSTGVDIFGVNETKGLSIQSGGVIIYEPPNSTDETDTEDISLIAIQQTGFSLGYAADKLEALDPYEEYELQESFIVWQKGQENEHNRLYIYADDIILRINEGSLYQQLFLKDKISQIDNNITTNTNNIITNAENIANNTTRIDENAQKIAINIDNITNNTNKITSNTEKITKIKAYWMISNNHLTLKEEAL